MKKKKKTLSPVSNNKLPDKPFGSPRNNNQIPSPRKVKANVRMLADDDRDNFSLLQESIESVGTYPFPSSPPQESSIYSRGTTPRSAPRGGRVYKDANPGNIISNRSSEVSLVIHLFFYR